MKRTAVYTEVITYRIEIPDDVENDGDTEFAYCLEAASDDNVYQRSDHVVVVRS